MSLSLGQETIVGFCMILTAISVYYFTGAIRNYSIRYSLIDTPNERSSHTVPTPRGGGVSITVAIILAAIILTIVGWIPIKIGVSILGGLSIVAIVGWLDDHKDIPALWRGVLYLIAAAWSVMLIGGMERIKFGVDVIDIGVMGSILAIIGTSWLTNLYNFMDGTDGIASVQAITTGVFGGILFWFNEQYGLSTLCFIIASSCCGFLIWNWPPAKIFMGDVGSCVIGFVFGVLAVIGEVTSSIPILTWFILLAIFIWDATLTLIKRVISGEKWYNPHRSHAYQRLTQLGLSHVRLAISILIINIIILWPLAYAAQFWENLSIYLTLFSFIVVFIIWGTVQFYYCKNKVHLR